MYRQEKTVFSPSEPRDFLFLILVDSFVLDSLSGSGQHPLIPVPRFAYCMPAVQIRYPKHANKCRTLFAGLQCRFVIQVSDIVFARCRRRTPHAQRFAVCTRTVAYRLTQAEMYLACLAYLRVSMQPGCLQRSLSTQMSWLIEHLPCSELSHALNTKACIAPSAARGRD